MKPILNLVVALFAFSVAFAMTSTQTVYASLEEERLFKWEVTRVIDGDTVGILVEWGPLELRKLSVRIRGIDTPEKGYRAKCDYEKEQGKIATQFMLDIVDSGETILFGNPQWGKYGGRIIADMYVGNANYSNLIMEAGLAKWYDGGKKSSFCD